MFSCNVITFSTRCIKASTILRFSRPPSFRSHGLDLLQKALGVRFRQEQRNRLVPRHAPATAQNTPCKYAKGGCLSRLLLMPTREI